MRRHRTWVLIAGLVLIILGAVLVVPRVLPGGVPGGASADAEEDVGRVEVPDAVTRTPPPETTPAAPSPDQTGRLTASRPEQGHRGRFEAESRRADGPGVQQGRVAHPERALFEPTAVRFLTATEAARAPVDPVDTLADGALDLPVDPQRIGWWTGGSTAGAPYGSVVLAGHLDSRSDGLGFAARMTGLGRGDTVVLSAGGRERRYRVETRYLLPRKRLSALTALFSGRGAARLVLLTCGGSYDAVRGAYSDNLVVEATPLP